MLSVTTEILIKPPSFMGDKHKLQLQDMSRSRRLVRFSRRFVDSSVHGYVLDVGPKFFLVALVSHDMWFNGFQCFRIQDISKLRADPHAGFVETALKKRKERRPRKPRVRLDDIGAILLSANRAFPLVTIFRERIRPDACWIGRVVDVRDGLLSLLEIALGAVWKKKPTDYRLAEITRVDFGGDYEDALHIVGGEPAI